MKRQILMLCAIFVLLPILSSCGGTAFVNLECDDFMTEKHITREIEIGTGYELSVYLCSNPSTGFSWTESAIISDPLILQQTDHKFVISESSTPPSVGTAGKEVWKFKANKKGTSTIKMEYGRPWEGGEKGEWTFILNVIVK